MRAFLNGKEGDVIAIAKDSNVAIAGLLMADDGGLHDLSTATLDAVVYSRADRNVTATATHACTVDLAADGQFTITIDDSTLTYGPGRFYAFIRRTLSADIQWANLPTVFDIK